MVLCRFQTRENTLSERQNQLRENLMEETGKKKSLNSNRKWQWGRKRVSSLLCYCYHSHTSSLLQTGLETVCKKEDYKFTFLYCWPTGHYVEVQHQPLQHVCVTKWFTVYDAFQLYHFDVKNVSVSFLVFCCCLNTVSFLCLSPCSHNERKVTCKHPVSGVPSQDNCIFVVNEQ